MSVLEVSLPICELYPFILLGHTGLDNLKYLKAKLCNGLFNAAWFRNDLAMPREKEREWRERCFWDMSVDMVENKRNLNFSSTIHNWPVGGGR